VSFLDHPLLSLPTLCQGISSTEDKAPGAAPHGKASGGEKAGKEGKKLARVEGLVKLRS
jgi:hypothetical protein